MNNLDVILKNITDLLSTLKAEEICMLDLIDKDLPFRFFVLANVLSDSHARLCSQKLCRYIKTDTNYSLLSPVSPTLNSGWVVLDFGAFICHLFDPELREKYALEKLLAINNSDKYVEELNIK